MLNQEKKDYTYIVLFICSNFLLENFSALLFIFLPILLNTFILLITLYAEYIYTGIHIFNFNSLSALLHTNFWEHVFHIISLFCIFSYGIILTTFFKFSLTLFFIKKLQNIKITFFETMHFTFNHTKEIIRFSFIKIFEYPEYWSSIIDIVEQSKRIKKLLIQENFLEDDCSEYSSPQQILTLPIIINTSLNAIDALKKSKELIQSNFGNITKYNYSFNKIRFITSQILLILCFVILNLILKFNVFFTLFIFIYVTTIWFYILTNLRLILNIIIYDYCITSNLKKFDTEDLKKIFY